MLKMGAVKAFRHYGSIGVTDVEWTDSKYQKHEAQLKFSSTKPRISSEECERLLKYAQEKKKENVIVWLVMKTAYKPAVLKRLN